MTDSSYELISAVGTIATVLSIICVGLFSVWKIAQYFSTTDAKLENISEDLREYSSANREEHSKMFSELDRTREQVAELRGEVRGGKNRSPMWEAK